MGDDLGPELRRLLDRQAILDCIRAGKAPSTVTAADGVSAVQICEAEEESVQTGRIVPLEHASF